MGPDKLTYAEQQLFALQLTHVPRTICRLGFEPERRFQVSGVNGFHLLEVAEIQNFKVIALDGRGQWWSGGIGVEQTEVAALVVARVGDGDGLAGSEVVQPLVIAARE